MNENESTLLRLSSYLISSRFNIFLNFERFVFRIIQRAHELLCRRSKNPILFLQLLDLFLKILIDLGEFYILVSLYSKVSKSSVFNFR